MFSRTVGRYWWFPLVSIFLLFQSLDFDIGGKSKKFDRFVFKDISSQYILKVLVFIFVILCIPIVFRVLHLVPEEDFIAASTFMFSPGVGVRAGKALRVFGGLGSVGHIHHNHLGVVAIASLVFAGFLPIVTCRALLVFGVVGGIHLVKEVKKICERKFLYDSWYDDSWHADAKYRNYNKDFVSVAT